MQNAPPEVKPKGGIAQFFSAFPLWIWVTLAGLFGGVAGLGGFTLSYANFTAYLGNDPETCAQCHIMREHFDAWARGPHHAVAVCNDCHAPHDNVVHKYFIKGVNGMRHSYAFTTGNYPDPLVITEMNYEVTQHACLYCHSDLTQAMNYAHTDEPTDCLTCHEGVGHDK